MCDRDDAALRNFSSRARQPKFIAELPKKPAQRSYGTYTPDATTINVNVAFDSGFGNNMSDNDTMRYRYLGTSPAYSAFNNSNARRNGTNCMRAGFTA